MRDIKDFKSIILKLAEEFPIAKEEPVKNHPLRSYIERELPEEFKNFLPSEFHHYLISSKAQGGRWVTAPWIIFLHPSITKSAQEGYYPSISFSENCKHLVLHIGQGMHNLQKLYGNEWQSVANARALYMKQKLPEHKERFTDNPSIMKNYRKNSKWGIASKFGRIYPIKKLPSNEELMKDLLSMLNLHNLLIERGGIENGEIPEDAKDLVISGKEAKIVKKHIEIEKVYYRRNQKLIKSLKENSDYTCEACGFNFNHMYVDSPNYIEAHHIVPISEMKTNEKTTTKEDIALLCSNCHKMIHKFGCPNLNDFKTMIKK